MIQAIRRVIRLINNNTHYLAVEVISNRVQLFFFINYIEIGPVFIETWEKNGNNLYKTHQVR